MGRQAEELSSTTLETALDALADPYRRQLLTALIVDNPQDDDDRDPLDVIESPAKPDVLETELYHVHLPKLEERGFIDWNQETGKVSKGPNWDDIAPLITLIDKHRDELPDGWL